MSTSVSTLPAESLLADWAKLLVRQRIRLTDCITTRRLSLSGAAMIIDRASVDTPVHWEAHPIASAA
jgi:hypothetical protein